MFWGICRVLPAGAQESGIFKASKPVSYTHLDVYKRQEEGFEVGGAQPFPFLQNLFGGNMPKNSGGELPKEAPGEVSTGERRQEKKSERKQRAEDKKRKYLNTYCENLTEKAREGKIDNVVGRQNEIYRVMQILNRRQKNNCLLYTSRCV